MNIGFTAGSWDLLHPGHVTFLYNCSEQCDKLFVGLHADPSLERKEKNRPIQTLYERMIQVSGCTYVDEILPYDTEEDLLNILRTNPIDKRFLGSDYEGQDFTGKFYCQAKGIEIVYIPREHNWSSTELRNRIIFKYFEGK